MPTYEQIPIRLALNLTSNPPVAPVDDNTGLAPRFWCGQTVAFQGGIFDPDGNPVDLSNLQYVQVVLQKAADSLTALVVKQIDAADLEDTITIGGWKDGSEQNFSALFDKADTGQALNGETEAEFWLIIQGLTDDDAPIIYGAGPVTIYQPGSSVPATSPTLVSRHAQTNGSGTSTVTPTSQVHTEVLTVNGAARTSTIILGIIGVQDGAQLNVMVILPGTADITLNFKNATTGGTQLSTLTTGTVLQALLEYYFNEDTSSWVPKFYALPPI